MKTCNECNIEKEYTSFRKDKSTPDGYARKCKKCQAARDRLRYATNEEYRNKVKQHNAQRFAQHRQNLLEYYTGKCCEHCGNEDHRTFEFHHKDPATKEFTIANDGHGRPWSTTLNEIQKCILLCANCHRIEHWRIRNQ